MENKVGRALRRGLALGLALAAAWGISLTADVEDLAALGEEPALAVSLMKSRLGELPGETRGLTGWGRLLLKGSPLLAAGEGAVLERRGGQETPGQADRGTTASNVIIIFFFMLSLLCFGAFSHYITTN